MEVARKQQAINLLKQYLTTQYGDKESNEVDSRIEEISEGESGKQINALKVNCDIDRKSKVIQELEKLGFIVIYPRKFETISGGYDKSEEEQKAKNTNVPLIIDTQEQYCSLQLADIIKRHYFSAATTEQPREEYHSYNNKKEYIVSCGGAGIYADGMLELEGIYRKLGFEDAKLRKIGQYPDGPDYEDFLVVEVSSKIPYVTVEKNKFEKIYEKAKNRCQGVMDKVKNMLSQQKTSRENDIDER